jgi:hypothetical protein
MGFHPGNAGRWSAHMGAPKLTLWDQRSGTYNSIYYVLVTTPVFNDSDAYNSSL